MLVGLLLAVVMVGAVFVPVISSSTTRTITTEIDNEGAGWLALGYNEGTDYSFTVDSEVVIVDEIETVNLKVGNQTGEYSNMICYADPQRTLFVSGDYWYLLTNGESPSVYKFSDTANVTNVLGTLTIMDGSETVYTGASPTWAYVPDANGVYGFFTEGGLNLEEGKPKVAVGSYAGVFAYNDTVVAPNDLGTLGLTMSGDYAVGEVIWIVAPSELDTLSALPTDTLEPAVVDLNPISIQPIDLGESGSVGLMSADPSNGTKIGDLYYTFSGGKATVIGYSSSADWSSLTTIPNTVSNNGVTYPVKEIGLDAFNGCTSLALTSLPEGLNTINTRAFKGCTSLALTSLPDSVTQISSNAFDGCTNLALTSLPAGLTQISSSTFKGCTSLALTSLPDITYIGTNAFNGCTNLALTSLPEGVTTVYNSAFSGCTSLALTSLPEGVTTIEGGAFRGCTSLALTSLPEGVTTIGQSAFEGCSGIVSLIVLGSPSIGNLAFSTTEIKEVLNFGETAITTTSYGLNADSVQDHVTALGYLAPTSIHETEVIPIDSPVAGLMQLLPLVAGIGALFLAVGTMIYTRF